MSTVAVQHKIQLLSGLHKYTHRDEPHSPIIAFKIKIDNGDTIFTVIYYIKTARAYMTYTLPDAEMSVNWKWENEVTDYKNGAMVGSDIVAINVNKILNGQFEFKLGNFTNDWILIKL